jgi:periplasmic protein TonB
LIDQINSKPLESGHGSFTTENWIFMQQRVRRLWIDRPVLLGLTIAGSLSVIGLSIAYLASHFGDQAMSSSPNSNAQRIEALPEIAGLSFMDRGNNASAAGKLFEPAGENALELFINARDKNEVGAENAVLELLPTASMQFDTAINKQSIDEAQRLLALITRADAKSPVLVSLQGKLEALELASEVVTNLTTMAPPINAPIANTELIGQTQLETPAAPLPTPIPEAPTVFETAVETPVAPVVRANAAQVASTATPSSTSASVAPQAKPMLAQPKATASASLARTVNATPRLINAPAPLYPPSAKRSKLEGWVDLKLTLRADGAVAEAEVVQSEPSGIFDMAAKRAAKRYRFEAGDGTSTVRHRMQFKISG